MFNGELLKEILEERGITLLEFSRKIGISVQTLYNYTKPKANPTWNNLEKMAAELNLNLDFFFQGKDIKSLEVTIGKQVNKDNHVAGNIVFNEEKREIEHLKTLIEEKERIIEEKERIIQLLMNK